MLLEPRVASKRRVAKQHEESGKIARRTVLLPIRIQLDAEPAAEVAPGHSCRCSDSHYLVSMCYPRFKSHPNLQIRRHRSAYLQTRGARGLSLFTVFGVATCLPTYISLHVFVFMLLRYSNSSYVTESRAPVCKYMRTNLQTRASEFANTRDQICKLAPPGNAFANKKQR